MNKREIMLGAVLCASLCLPFAIIKLKDLYTFHHSVSIADTKTQEILAAHPIITSLYEKQYETDKTLHDELVIGSAQIDTQDEQDALKQLQEQFSAQIDQLIQHQVLTADLLEIDAEEEYEPTFGTFSRWGESDILLQQIYRMWEDQDYKSVDYTMDEQTGKITRIEISQQKQMTYTEAQLKELSMRMIRYLELDDIEDWVYTRYGYESSQAKLNVNSTLDDDGETCALRIAVELQGSGGSIRMLDQDIYIIGG